MALLASEGNSNEDRELIPEGLHSAVCYAVVDLGNQWKEGSSNGQSWAKWTECITLLWEVPKFRDEFEGDDRPMVASREFTLSLHKKANLRPFLQGWRGKSFSSEELAGFDISKLIGVSCQLQIIHNEAGTWANVTAAMPATKKLTPENKTILFNIEDNTIPDKIPKFIANKIMESKEWGDREEIGGSEPSQHGDDPGPSDDDEIPF